jgi:eukaryotic-like serine/threonine-protein kinase
MLRDFVDGRYRVEQEVGRGGMGIVLRAFDTRLNRAVAIKILPPDATHDPDRLRRLAAEARAASALNHTGIATVYDFVEQGADSFIVYEYIDGRTLRNSLAHDRFSTDDVLGVGIQLADALVAAHTRGITHRDLKPENIMLVPDDHFRWRVKILDFGLAKQRPELLSAGTESGSETVSVATVPGLLVGTITYMAPEQLESRTTDERTDIYALGLVLYEMATGANPFMGRTLPSTIANILKQEPQPLRQKDPAAPAELDRILRKCLRKNPNERYQSTRELLVDLRDFRRNFALSPVTQVPAGAPGPLRRFLGTMDSWLNPCACLGDLGDVCCGRRFATCPRNLTCLV